MSVCRIEGLASFDSPHHYNIKWRRPYKMEFFVTSIGCLGSQGSHDDMFPWNISNNAMDLGEVAPESDSVHRVLAKVQVH